MALLKIPCIDPQLEMHFMHKTGAWKLLQHEHSTGKLTLDSK